MVQGGESSLRLCSPREIETLVDLKYNDPQIKGITCVHQEKSTYVLAIPAITRGDREIDDLPRRYEIGAGELDCALTN
jgi:hypothetical protein